MPISQKDFADQLRKKLPELKDFTDDQIVKKVLELRPDLVDKIENPILGDQQAAIAQAKAERRSRSIVDPETWQQHPTMKQFLQSATQSMPGIGAIAGGLASTPETLGTGTIFGTALGAGAGRGAQDLLEQALGLQDTTPLEKTKNIGMDTLLTATVPGVIEAVKAPIQSARLAAKSLINAESAVLPRWMRFLLNSEGLEKFANKVPERDPLVRPPSQSGIPVKDAEIVGPTESTIKEGEIVRKQLPASKVDRYQANPERKKLYGKLESDKPSPSKSPKINISVISQGLEKKPNFRLNNDGTFTNLDTGEVYDKFGKPLMDEMSKFKLYFGLPQDLSK